jgi:hypothetical protein
MKFGSDPPALVAATIMLGAGVSAALVWEAEVPAFLTTIGSGVGLTAGAGLAAAKESEIFRELFVLDSVLLRASESSATVVAGADFIAAFGCKVACGFDEDIIVGLEGDDIGEDSTGRGALTCDATSGVDVVDPESLETPVVPAWNRVQPAYRPTATTTAAAMPTSAFLLPPLDGSAAPPNVKEGKAELEDSLIPDLPALSKGTTVSPAALDAAGSTTAKCEEDRAGAGALAVPVPNPALPTGETGGATALKLGATGTFLTAGLESGGAAVAAFRAAASSPSISRTS